MKRDELLVFLVLLIDKKTSITGDLLSQQDDEWQSNNRQKRR